MPLFLRKKQEIPDMPLDYESDSYGNRIVMIPVDQILPNPSQPRKTFDQVDLVNLADSIRQHGLLQPISLRISSKSEGSTTTYICIAGERRLRAFKMLGRSHIPSILVATSPSTSAELAIIENIMRKDLNLFELAGALATLIEKYGMTQEELALKLSTSQSNIANKLRLLRFSPDEQGSILHYGLTERHCRAILRIQDQPLRADCISFVGENALNVSETEEYIDSLSAPVKSSKAVKKAYNSKDFCRFLDKRVSLMQKKGLLVTSEIEESDSEYKVVIMIAK